MNVRLAVIAALAVALLALLCWGHLVYWRRRLAVWVDYDSVERLPTPDGAAFELRHLAPSGPEKAASSLPPVLLVHGVGADHRNFDLDSEHSLARHLARSGRDVWLVTLRCALGGLSRGERRNMSFFDMATYDLPLAVQAVLQRTDSRHLDYVGFSMGGMLLYASVGRGLPAGSLRRVVTVGASAVLHLPHAGLIARWLAAMPAALVPTARLRSLALAVAFAAEHIETPLHGLFVNSRNLEPGVMQRVLANVLADVPGRLNWQFAKWAASIDGLITDQHGPLLGPLVQVAVPALFISGAADRLAPPEGVRNAWQAWGREVRNLEKRFVVLGAQTGAHADYGHADLAVGAHAREDVFELVESFLGAGPTSAT
jgi:polyhydroxyalkanoate synthase